MVSWPGCLCVVALLAAPAADPGPDLPRTVERVWYRGEQRPFGKVFRAGGDLVIREDGLEFVHRKHGWSVPLQDIAMISLGRMQGDVDTEWVVLSLRRGGPEPVVGLRDGRRFGYGGATRDLYRLLRAVARDRQIAQFDAPVGFTAYEPLDRMLAVAYPAGWQPSQLTKEIIADFALPLGRTVFRPEPGEGRTRLLVERTDVRDYETATCAAGLPDGLQQDVLDRFGNDPVSMGGLTPVREPQSAPWTLGPCAGVRVTAEGLDEGGRTVRGDLVAVVRNGVLYEISLVSERPDGPALMDAIVAGLRIAPTR